ncbi:hypothetical protein [Tissierella sp.]
MKKSKFKLLSLILVLVLMLSACGSGGSKTTDTSDNGSNDVVNNEEPKTAKTIKDLVISKV